MCGGRRILAGLQAVGKGGADRGKDGGDARCQPLQGRHGTETDESGDEGILDKILCGFIANELEPKGWNGFHGGSLRAMAAL